MGLRLLVFSAIACVSITACSDPVQRSGPAAETTSTRPAESTTTDADDAISGEEPDQESTDTRVLVVGDWGSGTVPQGAVAGAMERYALRHEVEAILTTGDNFYSDDAEFLMQPFDWVEAAGVEWWVTWGNHDIESEPRINAVNATFDPPLWDLIEWGQFDIVILDSNQVTAVPQAVFFLEAMAASGRPTIIALHHPPYSCSHHGSTVEIVNQWVEILDDDVVLVLSGHDHSYQRFEQHGISYVVSGGGGKELRPLTECPPSHPERLAGAEVHHFVSLHQTEGALSVTAIDVNGDVFDELVIELP